MVYIKSQASRKFLLWIACSIFHYVHHSIIVLYTIWHFVRTLIHIFRLLTERYLDGIKWKTWKVCAEAKMRTQRQQPFSITQMCSEVFPLPSSLYSEMMSVSVIEWDFFISGCRKSAKEWVGLKEKAEWIKSKYIFIFKISLARQRQRPNFCTLLHECICIKFLV